MTIRNEDASPDRDSAMRELRQIDSEMRKLKVEVEAREIAVEAFGERIEGEIEVLKGKVEGRVEEMKEKIRKLQEDLEQECKEKEASWYALAIQITGTEVPSDSQVANLEATFSTQQDQIRTLQSVREQLQAEFQSNCQSIISLIDASLDAAKEPMSKVCSQLSALEGRTEKELERLETAWEARSREIDGLAENLMRQYYEESSELV